MFYQKLRRPLSEAPISWVKKKIYNGDPTTVIPFLVFHGPPASVSPLSPSPVESLYHWSTIPGVGGIDPIEADTVPQLRELDDGRLIKRAANQGDRVEVKRLEVARDVFSSN